MSFQSRKSTWPGLLVLAWILAGAAPSLAQAPAPGAQAGASLWDGPAAQAATVSAPAGPDLGERVADLEQAVADLEKSVGAPRSLRVRQPMERRLEDLESRLDKMEKRMNDLENRIKRAETRN